MTWHVKKSVGGWDGQQSKVTHRKLPINVPAFIPNTAFPAYSLQRYYVLRWEAAGAENCFWLIHTWTLPLKMLERWWERLHVWMQLKCVWTWSGWAQVCLLGVGRRIVFYICDWGGKGTAVLVCEKNEKTRPRELNLLLGGMNTHVFLYYIFMACCSK